MAAAAASSVAAPSPRVLSESLARASSASANGVQCDHGFYRVAGQSSAPCARYASSAVDDAATQTRVYCCNCNQGEQWHNFQWTYVKDASHESCVSGVFVTNNTYVIIVALEAVLAGVMLLLMTVPMCIYTDEDDNMQCGGCVAEQAGGYRDGSGCWWRTDSRSVVTIFFLPFYLVQAFAMRSIVSSVNADIRPQYDSEAAMLGTAYLVLVALEAGLLPMCWFFLGRFESDEGGKRRRYEKNGFTVALFQSWHLHTYFYYIALLLEATQVFLTGYWLATVSLDDPRIVTGSGAALTRVNISPNATDVYSCVLAVFCLQTLSLLHTIAGVLVFDADFFKSRLKNVILRKRGAYYLVDYCVEEPIIRSLDCDCKKICCNRHGERPGGTPPEATTADLSSPGADSKSEAVWRSADATADAKVAPTPCMPPPLL